MRLDDILKVWEQRTQETKTLRYEWTEVKTEKTDFLPRDSMLVPVFVQPPKFDTDSVTHSQEHSFRASSDFVWHRRVGDEWDINTQQFFKKDSWVCFDFTGNTTVYKNLEQKGFPEFAPIEVSVNQNGAYQEKGFFCGPMLLHHRPLDGQLSPIQQQHLKLTADRESIQSHLCARVVESIGESNTSYWVDVQSPYLIRRVELAYKDRLGLRLEVDYAQDPQGNWIVDKWRLEAFFDDNQKPQSSSVATVTRSVVNGELEARAELATIPVGAQVADGLGQDRRDYILLPDGRKREITEDDSKYGLLTYQELLASEPGQGYPADFVKLSKALKHVGKLPDEERDQLLAQLKERLKNGRCLYRDYELVRSTTYDLYGSKDPEAGIRMCREFADEFPALRQTLLEQAREFVGELRYKKLLGSELQLTGKTTEGQVFDWGKYRGKVVLVNFWFVGCKACVEELPLLKQMSEKYKEAGFEIVGVDLEDDVAELKPFLEQRGIDWTNILDHSESEDSNVGRYNIWHICSFPMSIIVDRNGKVTALDVKQDDLEQRIKEALEIKAQP